MILGVLARLARGFIRIEPLFSCVGVYFTVPASLSTMSRTTLTVVCGAPGVGKSTAAGHIRRRLNARRFSTDVIRQELFPDPDYSSEESRKVYETMFYRAQKMLKDNTSVVLDGTFRMEDGRIRAMDIAKDYAQNFEMFRIEANENKVEERLQNRGENSVSDADFAIHQEISSRFEPINANHEVVTNNGDKSALYYQIDDVLEAKGLISAPDERIQ